MMTKKRNDRADVLSYRYLSKEEYMQMLGQKSARLFESGLDMDQSSNI